MVHRDLHLGNVLVRQDWPKIILKIIDFGAAALEEEQSTNCIWTEGGNPTMSPEELLTCAAIIFNLQLSMPVTYGPFGSHAVSFQIIF